MDMGLQPQVESWVFGHLFGGIGKDLAGKRMVWNQHGHILSLLLGTANKRCIHFSLRRGGVFCWLCAVVFCVNVFLLLVLVVHGPVRAQNQIIPPVSWDLESGPHWKYGGISCFIGFVAF